MTKAIVFPVRTGKDWCEPEPPLVIERDSKTTAIKALRKAGYRVMRVGGNISAYTITSEELREWRGDNADVMRAVREFGFSLPDDWEGTVYSITVHP